MNNDKINKALDALNIGSIFNTPDNIRSVSFSIAGIDPGSISIILNSGNPLTVTRQAFFAANDFLINNNHNSNNPALIGSSNEDDESGPLCLATKEKNSNVRCINYIVPILTQIGAVGFSGNNPNTCWYM
jgi:hypothetical protein